MELCNHKECEKKRFEWLRGTKMLEERSNELYELRRDGYRLKWSEHEIDREELRGVLPRHAEEVLDNGQCIWFGMYNHPLHGLTYKWVWMGYCKINKGHYRPLHLVLMVNPDNPSKKIVIGTVYDPSASPQMWDESFLTRICWK